MDRTRSHLTIACNFWISIGVAQWIARAASGLTEYTMPCVCLTEPVKSGSLDSPILLLENTDKWGGYLVAEQNGKIHAYTSAWKKHEELFLDLSDIVAFDNQDPTDERGLLSFVLHPAYRENGKFYTYSTRTYDGQDYIVVSEIKETDGRGDLSTEKILLAIQQPSAKRNGGTVLFGPDGYLYISVGDGGVPGNTGNEQMAGQAQDGHSFLGKILRIDVDNWEVKDDILRYFRIPPENPFIGNQSFRPEVYAYGCRNMFRCSFDEGSPGKEMYCGDNGNHDQEEINIIKEGGNYGWNKKEGNVCLSPGNCHLENEVPPIYTFNNSETHHAVIGGYVYRGSAFPAFKGHYLFGDVAGGLMSLDNTTGQLVRHNISICPEGSCPCDARAEYGNFLRTLSQDNNGELYVMTTTFGASGPSSAVLKLMPKSASPVTCAAGMAQLSLTLTTFIGLLAHVMKNILS
ncbi:HHIP-like protein 1 [Mizuhopecten yessoensis]|uniref:HHIP-like protein 1 n=1 Tax=Mizuhopecten yessoensis TaxID=6573 RepID=A0A210R1B6_MIZYE|nr:HHIP-like protein 1 [Mizuhopecten yessoensis]OWF54691.1 HHIP-like protein 1 [Mizuhopecten yessoensis]